MFSKPELPTWGAGIFTDREFAGARFAAELASQVKAALPPNFSGEQCVRGMPRGSCIPRTVTVSRKVRIACEPKQCCKNEMPSTGMDHCGRKSQAASTHEVRMASKAGRNAETKFRCGVSAPRIHTTVSARKNSFVSESVAVGSTECTGLAADSSHVSRLTAVTPASSAFFLSHARQTTATTALGSNAGCKHFDLANSGEHVSFDSTAPRFKCRAASGTPTTCHHLPSDSSTSVGDDCASDNCNMSSEIAKAVAIMPSFMLRDSLHLSSPCAALCVSPPLVPSPPVSFAPGMSIEDRELHKRLEQQQQLQQQQQLLEQEEFASLIFPGFKSDAFMWEITCWQVAGFAVSMLIGRKHANPLPCVLYSLGASWGPAIARGQIWRLVTPVMLHASLTHLLFNVFFQLRIGFGMERQFGRSKMMLLYFACGVVGNLLSVAFDPHKLAVGASTAGFGLIGVWISEILLSWETLGPARERTIIWIGFMLISVTTMSAMTPNIDLFGHLGGALGGLLLSIIISDMREEVRPWWMPQARSAATVALALLVTGSLGKVMLMNPRDPLPSCPIDMFSHVTAALPTKLVSAMDRMS